MPRRQSISGGVFLPACLVGGGLFLLLWVGLGVPAPLGWVTRTEFSPELFRFRTTGWFVVFQVPLTSVYSEPRLEKLTRFLHTRGYVPPVRRVSVVRWHLVRGRYPAYTLCPSPARWLERALGGWGQGEEVWITWSQGHPRLAQVLWPQVVRWVRGPDSVVGYYNSYLLLHTVFYQPPEGLEELKALIRKIEQEEQPKE